MAWLGLACDRLKILPPFKSNDSLAAAGGAENTIYELFINNHGLLTAFLAFD